MRGTYPASAGEIDRDFLSLAQGDGLGVEFFDFVNIAGGLLLSISLGNATFGGFIVGRASRLPSNDLPTQARRPRYIQKSKSKLLLV